MRDDSLARRVAGAAMGAAAMASLALAAPAVAQERQYELVTPADDGLYHARMLTADPDLNRIYYEVGVNAGRPGSEQPDAEAVDYFAATRGEQGWEESWLTPYCPGKFSVYDDGDCGGSLEEIEPMFGGAGDGRVTFAVRSAIPPGKPAPRHTADGTYEIYSGDAHTTGLLSWPTAPDPGGWGAGFNRNGGISTSPDQSTVAFSAPDARVPEAAGLPAGAHLYVRRGDVLTLASAPVGGAPGDCSGSCVVGTLAFARGQRSPSTAHVVSDDGRRVFFRTNRRLHPDATTGRQGVYVLDGDQLRLLSDGLTDPAGDGANSSFEWAAANGSRAFIVTGTVGTDSQYSPVRSSGRIWAVDVPSETATPISPAGVWAQFVWASDDGSTALFTTGTSGDSPRYQLHVWRQGSGTTYVGPWFATGDNRDTIDRADPGERDVRGTADGSTIVWSTRAGIDPEDTNGAADLYRLRGNTVTWLTPRAGAAATGDIVMSSALDAGGPGAAVSARPRALSADAETVFFSTSASLVPEDTDGGMLDVYSVRDGQYTLITPPGDEQHDAWLNDNSDDGSAVLFSTQASLTEIDTDGGMIDVYSARTSGAFADRLPESSTGAPPVAAGPGAAAPVPSAPSGSSPSAPSPDPVPLVPEWPADPGASNDGGGSSGGELGLEDGPVFRARRAVVPLVVPGRGQARVVLKGRVGKRVRTLARGSRSFARGGERSVRLRLTRHGRRFDGRRVSVRVVFVGADGERQRLRERVRVEGSDA